MSEISPPNYESCVAEFLEQHRLPDDYRQTLDQQIAPIARDLAQRQKHHNERSLWLAINGSQGSGKTTMADALVMQLRELHQLKAVAVSIDDFYLTRAQRQALASDIHPLLMTRGVPGTHDIALAQKTLQALSEPLKDQQPAVIIPRFDKAIDDRAPESDWTQVDAPVDIIILEGWCVGAQAQSMTALIEPVNELEQQDDHEGNWRHYVNAQLQLDYRELFERFDVNLMLKAPSFDSVYRWRLEQENKLKDKTGGKGEGLMSESEVLRFIQHYQRITEHNLEVLPEKMDYLLELDEQRRIF
ncbi:MAG: hypothetical protein ACRBBW_20065 [Cellvibrionaceae bacterium]